MREDQLIEATGNRLYNKLPEALQDELKTIRQNLEQEYRSIVGSLTLTDLRRFNKHDCHLALQKVMNQHVADAGKVVPELVVRNETFWLSNALSTRHRQQ